MKFADTLFIITSAVVLLFLFPQNPFADEPPMPPSIKTVWSLNKKYYALMDPEKNITTVYQVSNKDRQDKFWSMYGWFRIAGLSSDGSYLVAGHDGMNLLPRNHRKDEVMLYFFHEGKLVNYVTLDQLIKDTSKLQKTASHIYWGNYIGLDENDRYLVETVENRKIIFDVTGKELKRNKELIRRAP